MVSQTPPAPVHKGPGTSFAPSRSASPLVASIVTQPAIEPLAAAIAQIDAAEISPTTITITQTIAKRQHHQVPPYRHEFERHGIPAKPYAHEEEDHEIELQYELECEDDAGAPLSSTERALRQEEKVRLRLQSAFDGILTDAEMVMDLVVPKAAQKKAQAKTTVPAETPQAKEHPESAEQLQIIQTSMPLEISGPAHGSEPDMEHKVPLDQAAQPVEEPAEALLQVVQLLPEQPLPVVDPGADQISVSRKIPEPAETSHTAEKSSARETVKETVAKPDANHPPTNVPDAQGGSLQSSNAIGALVAALVFILVSL